MISISHRTLAEIALLDLEGRMIGDAANTFVAAASEAIVEGGARKLVLNFKGLEQCDSMGISGLLRIHNSLENMGGRLVICDVHGLVAKVFAITHIDEVLHILDSEEEAMAALGVTSILQEA